MTNPDLENIPIKESKYPLVAFPSKKDYKN